MTVVLDASALLAYLMDEPGAEVVDGVVAESALGSVNWAEVVQKSISAGVDVEGMLEDLQALGLRVEPFPAVDGDTAGRLWGAHATHGVVAG
jgi:PIN domain nuclease of toxin-antitoxin system